MSCLHIMTHLRLPAAELGWSELERRTLSVETQETSCRCKVCLPVVRQTSGLQLLWRLCSPTHLWSVLGVVRIPTGSWAGVALVTACCDRLSTQTLPPCGHCVTESTSCRAHTSGQALMLCTCSGDAKHLLQCTCRRSGGFRVCFYLRYHLNCFTEGAGP